MIKMVCDVLSDGRARIADWIVGNMALFCELEAVLLAAEGSTSSVPFGQPKSGSGVGD
jgi:hypothetical protein